MANKLATCRWELIEWTKEQGIISAQIIFEAQSQLESALSATVPDHMEINRIKVVLEKAYNDEEIFWKQRSCILWLQCDNKNTKFFYTITKSQRAINQFTVLEDVDGVSHHGEQDFSRIISSYFQDIFTTKSQGDFSVLEEILNPCISHEDNEILTALPS